MIMRSIRLFEAMLPMVLTRRVAQPIHVTRATVLACQIDVTNPVRARTIHAASANGATDTALASLR